MKYIYYIYIIYYIIYIFPNNNNKKSQYDIQHGRSK